MRGRVFTAVLFLRLPATGGADGPGEPEETAMDCAAVFAALAEESLLDLDLHRDFFIAFPVFQYQRL